LYFYKLMILSMEQIKSDRPPLLTFTNAGIYCAKADVYIDPWRPVEKALITHGHSDHARYGSRHYMAVESAVPVIKYRLGSHIKIQGVSYGASTLINGVKFSFHPAGHILGSAQIRVEYQGEIWVVSGDYKIEDDGLSEAFEPVRCQHFVTESTFGLPAFHWEPQDQVMEKINQWWRENRAQGKTSIIAAYALGKAQRILRNIDTGIGPIFTHGAIENTNEVIRGQKVALPHTERVVGQAKDKKHDGALIIAPPSAAHSSWIQKFTEPSVAVASGWMGMRGAKRRRSVETGFVLSDHADWDGLNHAIQATGADHVYVTHGYTDIFSKWLCSQGYDAQPVKTAYVGETADVDTSEDIVAESDIPDEKL